MDQCEEAEVVRNSSGMLLGWSATRVSVNPKSLPVQKYGARGASPEDLEHFTVLSFDQQGRQVRRRDCVVPKGFDAASYMAEYGSTRPGVSGLNTRRNIVAGVPGGIASSIGEGTNCYYTGFGDEIDCDGVRCQPVYASVRAGVRGSPSTSTPTKVSEGVEQLPFSPAGMYGDTWLCNDGGSVVDNGDGTATYYYPPGSGDGGSSGGGGTGGSPICGTEDDPNVQFALDGGTTTYECSVTTDMEYECPECAGKGAWAYAAYAVIKRACTVTFEHQNDHCMGWFRRLMGGDTSTLTLSNTDWNDIKSRIPPPEGSGYFQQKDTYTNINFMGVQYASVTQYESNDTPWKGSLGKFSVYFNSADEPVAFHDIYDFNPGNRGWVTEQAMAIVRKGLGDNKQFQIIKVAL